jgi:hypothetical protein
MPTDVRVNRWLDLLDRVGWTAIQVTAGTAVSLLAVEGMTWKAAGITIGVAVLSSVCKVVLAQNSGSNNLGAAVPGQVLTQTPSAPAP